MIGNQKRKNQNSAEIVNEWIGMEKNVMTRTDFIIATSKRENERLIMSFAYGIILLFFVILCLLVLYIIS